MSEQVSAVRLNLLRVAYFSTSAFLGFRVWPELIAGEGGLEPWPGVAVSLYAAMSVLFLLGLGYPLAMLPLLFLQLFYKVVWLLAVWLPGRANGTRIDGFDLVLPFIIVVVLDLVVIPWPYVVARFVRASGDRWKRNHAPTLDSSQPSVRGGVTPGS